LQVPASPISSILEVNQRLDSKEIKLNFMLVKGNHVDCCDCPEQAPAPDPNSNPFDICEGSSMRSITRICGVSLNTVAKLLVDAGNACTAFHHEQVRNVTAKSIQCDEIWSFSYAKNKNLRKAAPLGSGDVWTWTGLDADTKLIVSWRVGDRHHGAAMAFNPGDGGGHHRQAHGCERRGCIDRRPRTSPGEKAAGGLSHVEHIAQSQRRLIGEHLRDNFNAPEVVGLIPLKEEVPAWVRHLYPGHRDLTVSQGRNAQCAVVIEIHTEVKVGHDIHLGD
jgi:hypothetical protein